jgi:hypothetical protein
LPLQAVIIIVVLGLGSPPPHGNRELIASPSYRFGHPSSPLNITLTTKIIANIMGFRRKTERGMIY